MAWGPVVLWAIVLFGLSELRGVPDALRPLGALPSEGIHFGLYAAMGGCLAWARRRTALRAPHLFFLVVGSAYGALDEWHQSFVPGRTPTVSDWAVDTLGVLTGYIVITLLRANRPGARGRPVE